MEFLNHFQEFISSSLEETVDAGKEIAKFLKAGSTVALYGDLGAGKTTLIKTLASALNNTDSKHITSPTFSYLHIYPGEVTVYHFDLYRLKNEEEFLFLGFDEYLSGNGVCLIEWPERIASLLPKNTFKIYITHLEETKRHIKLYGVKT